MSNRPVRDSERKTVATVSIATAVTILALVVRLAFIGRASLWFDEAVSYFSAGLPLSGIATNTAQSSHPPLYYLALAGWRILVPTATRPCAR
jgi:uncharacterized membrane protein